MNYCEHHQVFGAKFMGNTTVTTVTIPPIGGERILLFAIQAILMNGGKIWENPICNPDGSFVLTPITFQSDEGREKCCQEIENAIEEALDNDMKFLLLQFQDIMKKIRPLIDFIESNGGWFNKETGQFSEFDALQKALINGTLSKKQVEEIRTALSIFNNFMGAYMIGDRFLKDNNITIVP